LKIARMTWSKSVVNSEKKLSSLIVKIYSVEQIDRLIKNDLLHEYTQIICELFVNNCRIKQCFNCQKYEHIDKICRYERRCFVCSESHNDFACKVSIDKRKCVNCEDNHSVWFFQCKIRVTEKNRISDIWRTKSILYSTDLKDTSRTISSKLDVVVQQTLIRSDVTSSTSSFCFFIEEILTQEEIEILESIMHLKIENYTVDEITEKRTLSQSSERSMSSSFRQRSVSVVQMTSSQTSNAFDVLKNHSSTRTSQNTIQDTQSQRQSQTDSRSREWSFNSRKTIESRQNDDELWQRSSRLRSYSTTSEMIKRERWCRFWSIRESRNTIYWQFKNRDETFACRRLTIRLISTFIYYTRTLKMWESAFTSTLDCTWITDS
jgi:hypothetical protein